MMMKSLPVLLMALLLLQGQAQQVQLTLNCQIESAVDFKTGHEGQSSGSFSAIVRMSSSQDATIEATTDFCSNYLGSFTEQEVNGDCERIVGNLRYWALLTINRINGGYFVSSSTTDVITDVKYLGHCTPGKKLF
jgi:hypothetical protein